MLLERLWIACSWLEEVDFSLSAAGKTWENLSTCFVPSGELLWSNFVQILSSIHSFSESWSLKGTAANVEAPWHEGTNLVGVKGAVNVGWDTLVELSKVLLEKLISSCLCDGESSVNIWSSVTVTDGPNSNWVLIGCQAKTLEFLNEFQGSSHIPGLLRHENVIIILFASFDINILWNSRAFSISAECWYLAFCSFSFIAKSWQISGRSIVISTGCAYIANFLCTFFVSGANCTKGL